MTALGLPTLDGPDVKYRVARNVRVYGVSSFII